MPSSRLKLPSLLAAVILVAGCSGTTGSLSDASVFYSTSEVAIGNVSEIVSSYGRVAAQEEETMTFDSVSGTVSEIYVTAGQTVQEGAHFSALTPPIWKRNLSKPKRVSHLHKHLARAQFRTLKMQ